MNMSLRKYYAGMVQVPHAGMYREFEDPPAFAAGRSTAPSAYNLEINVLLFYTAFAATASPRKTLEDMGVTWRHRPLLSWKLHI